MNVIPHPHVVATGRGATIRGSHVLVRRLWFWRTRGASLVKLLRRYDFLPPAHVLDALAFAMDNIELMEAEIAGEQEARARGTRGEAA